MSNLAPHKADAEPSLGDRNKTHFDQVADQVFKHPWIIQLCNQVSEHLRDKFASFGVPKSPHESRMLDYACGNGVASRALAEHVSLVRGMDISSGMVEQYNALARAAGYGHDKMRAIQGDLMDPASTPNPAVSSPDLNGFDFVFMGMALHHVEEYVRMVRELSARLGPDGVLVIVDWVAISESGCPEAPKMRELSHKTMSSRMGFTQDDIRSAFDGAGLQDFLWEWFPERTKVPDEIGGEQQLFLARGRKVA